MPTNWLDWALAISSFNFAIYDIAPTKLYLIHLNNIDDEEIAKKARALKIWTITYNQKNGTDFPICISYKAVSQDELLKHTKTVENILNKLI